MLSGVPTHAGYQLRQLIEQIFIPTATPTQYHVPIRQVANGARLVPLRKGNVTIRAGSRTSLAGSWAIATCQKVDSSQAQDLLEVGYLQNSIAPK